MPKQKTPENEPHYEQWELDFIEKGAALEHARWGRWQQHLHDKTMARHGLICFSQDDFLRWQRQIDTPYEALSEPERESDRREVREYLPLIRQLIAQERNRIRAIIEDNKLSDDVVYDHGLPPADILPDMLHDIRIAREATNGTLNEILKAMDTPQRCSTSPLCSHNTNGRALDKPCSVQFVEAHPSKWNGTCRCGHKHDQHGPSQNINFTRGNCQAEDCYCKGFVNQP